MCSASYCTALPLGLYVNILDLNLFGSQIVLAGLCCAASFYGLSHYYHESAKSKKHSLHDDMRSTARSKSGKTHVSHDDTEINTKAVNFSLAYNNFLYLASMVFFGFFFLKDRSLEVNYPLSVFLTSGVMFFANQEM